MRTAWITGAGSGIGRALALRLARDGVAVAATARSGVSLRQLVRGADGLAGRIVPLPGDVTDAAAMAAVVTAAEDALGPLDTAVLNAGTHAPMSADSFSVDTARRLIEVNYMGAVHGLAAVLPRFLERRSGRIAVVASVAGYRGLPTAAAYGPTKAALINLCESLKPDCDRAGVVLQVVNPGFVATPLTDRNDFPMPDIVSAEAAAEAIVRGLRSDRFEIAFPRRFVRMLAIARLLPYGLYFRAVRRVTGVPADPRPRPPR